MSGALTGLRILDLTRILAGPVATQILGDLGAEVIKVERPGSGDDTRRWGPPYLDNGDDETVGESAYYLSANRNKHSITLDLSRPEGQALARRLVAECDVLIENFKVGDLARRGLGYDALKDDFPGLIYCSISGFGQTGPYAARAGYDMLAQAMGGLMSITGDEHGDPAKVGVAIADVMTGMYANIAILAALRHREATGEGQYIDMALLDCQVAWLANAGMNYLVGGPEHMPRRMGTTHPNIVPYQALPASDGYFMLAIGNDSQFRKFCDFAGLDGVADDPRFATNDARVRHRETLIAMLRSITEKQPIAHWLDGLAPLGVPAGPVNDIAQVFADPQVVDRGMRIDMPHPASANGTVPLIASPIRLSRTPVDYRRPPPTLGQDTEAVLSTLLALDAEEIAALSAAGVI